MPVAILPTSQSLNYIALICGASQSLGMREDRSQTAVGGRPRRRRKEERPGEIAAAALSVFAEKGFAAARIDDVAARAGTSKGTVYLYFDTKEALFEAVVREAFLSVLDRAAVAARDPAATCADLLRELMATIYRELVNTERREILRLLIAEAPRFPKLVEFYHREAIGRGKAILRSIVVRGVSTGEFAGGPVAEHPELIIGPAIMTAIWKLVFDPYEPIDAEKAMAAHVDLVLNGLLARG